MGISYQRCPNPACGRKLAPSLLQVFLDPVLDVVSAAKPSSSEARGGASSSNRGCATLVLVGAALCVAYFAVKAFVSWVATVYLYLITGAVVAIGLLVFALLAKRVGFGRAAAICVLPAIGAAIGLRGAFVKQHEERERVLAAAKAEEDAKKDEETAKKTQLEKVVQERRAKFGGGYRKMVETAPGSLPSTLVGAWKLKGRFGSDLTMTATMVSGTAPSLLDAHYRLTPAHLLISGMASDRVAAPCAGVVESVGVGDRVLFALGCQGDDVVRWDFYTGANAKFAGALKSSSSVGSESQVAQGDDALVPPYLRGVWLASSDGCPAKDSKRRVVITPSMIVDYDASLQGLVQVRALPEGDAVRVEGMGGSFSDAGPCAGRIEPAGTGAYLMRLACETSSRDTPIQLCKKTTVWQDFLY